MNGKGYVGFGWTDGTCNDLWEYDPNRDLRSKKANFPGKPRYDAIDYSFEDYEFVACGGYQDSGIEIEYLTDLRRYEPTSDAWTKIRTDYKGKGRVQMIAEVIYNKIIIGLESDDISHGPY